MQEQVQRLGQQDAHLQDEERRLQDQSKWLEDQERRLREQRRELAERDERIELLGARYSELAATMAQARSHYEEFRLAREQFLRAERRLRRLLNAEVGNGAPASDQTLPPPSEPSADFDYAGFEDRLRDSRMIKDKQRGYVEYFAGQAPVIDLGCGRGEFLELMHEAGIQAQGVDLDLDMILLCKEKGLDAVRAEAIDYLSGLPDNSLGGIFSAQVIEHLTTAQLSNLIKAAARKIKPGGTLVLETLNPESLFVHFRWFWMDPSHHRLVHPQTLQFMLESAGFAGVCCRFASPPEGAIPIPPLQISQTASLEEFNRATDSLNKLLYTNQEYAMIARR